MQKYFAMLPSLPLFAGIDTEDVPQMLRCLSAVRATYRKGTYIRVEGDAADFIGIVLEGGVQILREHYDGTRRIVAVLGTGDMFAEAYALSGAAELPVSIVASEDATILFLDAISITQEHAARCRFHELLMRNLLRIMAHKNMLLSQKLNCVSRKTTAEKLLAFLSDQARQQHATAFTIPYNRQALADYLGVERSALSAVIGALQRQGVLEAKGSFFRLPGHNA